MLRAVGSTRRGTAYESDDRSVEVDAVGPPLDDGDVVEVEQLIAHVRERMEILRIDRLVVEALPP